MKPPILLWNYYCIMLQTAINASMLPRPVGYQGMGQQSMSIHRIEWSPFTLQAGSKKPGDAEESIF